MAGAQHGMCELALETDSGTDTRRLTTGISSEKCVVSRFRRCERVLNTNLDSIAYYTPRLYGTVYSS
jgi:hypothetical protein